MQIDGKKILCVGLNYKSHAEETGGEAPKEPVIFSKFSDTLAQDGQEIALNPGRTIIVQLPSFSASFNAELSRNGKCVLKYE